MGPVSGEAPAPGSAAIPAADGEAAERLASASASRLATTGLVVQAVLALAALAVAVLTGSFAAFGVAAHLGAGACAWAAGAALAARRSRASEERAEAARLSRSALDEGRRPLFLQEERRASLGGEARLGAALALALALVEGSLATALVFHGAAHHPERLLGGAAVLAGSAFVLLLLAKYSLGLLPDDDARGTGAGSLVLAAPGARRAASGAIAAFAGAVLLALLDIAPTLQLDAAGYAFAGLEGLLAVELLLGIVLELYRPRRKGEVPRPAFESRLLSLVAAPSGIARSLARVVDYQFGFQLSETWAYRLVERGVAPLALFLAVVTWLLSCFVVVPSGERAILARLGIATKEPLEPGLHVKLPWPFDTTTPVEVERIREVILGPKEDDEYGENGRAKGAILWTGAPSQHDLNLLVAEPRASGERGGDAPVSLLAARIPVAFRVADAYRY
ncbi:hypothetical protein HY251_06305, partial [bacterium]|nr:hypothetical protein [bacterium]